MGKKENIFNIEMRWKFSGAGSVLRDYRENILQVTQRDLAKSLGNMNSQFVSNWERGLCLPPKHAMPKLLNKMPKDWKNHLKSSLQKDLINHYWGNFE